MQTKKDETTRQKIGWVEYAKGFAIFSVVAWHVNGGIITNGLETPEWMQIFGSTWDLFAFRAMPIFFVISALFVVRSLRKPSVVFWTDKIRTILYPYILWSLITLLFGTVLSRFTNHGMSLSDLPQLLYEPVMHYWFLYALFVIFIMYFAAHKFQYGRVLLLIFSIVIYIIGIQANLVEQSYVLAQICNFTVYFVIAAMTGQHILRWLETAQDWQLLGVSIVGLAGFSPFFLGLVPVNIVTQTAASVLLLIGLCTLSEWLDRRAILGIVKHWGQYSLEIYLAHVLALSAARIILLRFAGIDNPLIHLVIGTVVGIYAPLLLVWVANKVGIHFLFTLPKTWFQQQQTRLSSAR